MPFTLRCDVHVPTRTKTVLFYLVLGSSHVHGSRLVGISSSYRIGWACAKNVCCTLTIHATHARCFLFFHAFSCFFLLFSAFSAFWCLSGWVPSGSEAGQLPTFQQRLVVAILQNKNRPSTQPKFNRELLLCFGLPLRKSTNRQEKARKGKKWQRKAERSRIQAKHGPGKTRARTGNVWRHT